MFSGVTESQRFYNEKMYSFVDGPSYMEATDYITFQTLADRP